MLVCIFLLEIKEDVESLIYLVQIFAVKIYEVGIVTMSFL